MYRFFIKYDTFEYTLMSLASPQLRYEMSRFHIEHPVAVVLFVFYFLKCPRKKSIIPTFWVLWGYQFDYVNKEKLQACQFLAIYDKLKSTVLSAPFCISYGVSQWHVTNEILRITWYSVFFRCGFLFEQVWVGVRVIVERIAHPMLVKRCLKNKLDELRLRIALEVFLFVL